MTYFRTRQAARLVLIPADRPDSVLFTVYLACIRPYVTKTTTALEIGPGRGAWFHWGIDNACAVIEQCGFTVVDRDIGAVHRDPLTHFQRL